MQVAPAEVFALEVGLAVVRPYVACQQYLEPGVYVPRLAVGGERVE